ncbi:MAG: orotate phosphoribosyltransferase [Candidatus Omnitrophica bacterium]|nr:orotate phosphoribosyltransferase [Candidatus Omnitrophota bacterium]MBI2174736.1 orotate phosphoribosyltransferase [Candidatus Omnitrophota bacterium]
MLTREKILEMFRRSNALQRGHFELSSGLHSGHYFQCAQVLQYPKQATAICAELARRFKASRPTVAIGPAIGGILVAYEAARTLKARAVYAERVDAEMQLRRGFTLTSKDRVIIVEDAITTGESAKKVAALVESFNAKVIGIGTIVDRSGGQARFPGRRFVRLLSLAFETFAPHACPLCSEQIPVTRPGRIVSRPML